MDKFVNTTELEKFIKSRLEVLNTFYVRHKRKDTGSVMFGRIDSKIDAYLEVLDAIGSSFTFEKGDGPGRGWNKRREDSTKKLAEN